MPSLFTIRAKYIPYLKEKWGHAGFQKYFKNTSWMFIGHSATLISLATNIWMARYLGPENFGSLSYIISFVGIFSFLAGLGIYNILIRDLVKYPEKRDELLGTSFGLLIMSGTLTVLLIAILTIIFESSPLIKTLIILYSTVFLLIPTNVISYYFQATVQAKKNALIQIIGVTTVSIIKGYLIISGKGIIWLTSTFVLDYLLGSILCILTYKQTGLSIKKWKFNRVLAQDLLKASWFLMLSSAASYILVRIDQVMVKHYLGETSVGIYAVAVKLSEIWYFVPGLICASLFPAIINAKKTNMEIYFKRLKKLYLFLGGTATLIAIPITLLAPWLIKILYGNEYMPATSILQIYIWSGIGLFLNSAIVQYFTAENRLKLIFFYNLSAVIINIVLNLILIPAIGLTGAAWSTLISYSVVPIMFFISKKFVFIKNNA